jgi:hypothetical protein
MCSGGEGKHFRVLLRHEDEFCCQERLFLILSSMGAVHNVRDELRAKWEFNLAAIDVFCLFSVHDEKVIAAAAPRDIHIELFPNFEPAVILERISLRTLIPEILSRAKQYLTRRGGVNLQRTWELPVMTQYLRTQEASIALLLLK